MGEVPPDVLPLIQQLPACSLAVANHVIAKLEVQLQQATATFSGKPSGAAAGSDGPSSPSTPRSPTNTAAEASSSGSQAAVLFSTPKSNAKMASAGAAKAFADRIMKDASRAVDQLSWSVLPPQLSELPGDIDGYAASLLQPACDTSGTSSASVSFPDQAVRHVHSPAPAVPGGMGAGRLHGGSFTAVHTALDQQEALPSVEQETERLMGLALGAARQLAKVRA